MPIVEYRKGDLLESNIPMIAHGVNCLGTFGAGIALQIAKKWPSSELKYREFCFKHSKDPRVLLGKSLATHEKEAKKVIFHIFTQEKVGVGTRQVNYGALAKGFFELNESLALMHSIDCEAAAREGESMPPLPAIAIPKIGAGLGGGDWNIIEEIINGVTPDVAVVVYERD